jgi:uncharacterized protein
VLIEISEHVDELRYILQNLSAENPDVQGSTLVSVQGLPICSLMNEDINDSLTSAMSAAILSVSDRAAEELRRGKLKRVLLEGDDGQMILSQAGDHAILVTLIEKDAGLGIILMLIDASIRKIRKILDA